MLQLAVLQDLAVQRCYAVDAVGKMNIHVRHVYGVPLVDDGSRFISGAVAGDLIQLFDDGHQLGYDLIQVAARPLLQRFCQDGVVGVGAGVGYDFNGFIKCDALLFQQADELRNHHAGMGIVDLDGGIVGEIMIVATALHALLQDHLRARADHQVLLVNAQHAAGFIGIIRIEEQGQVLVDLLFIKGDAFGDDGLVDAVQIEQVQHVGAAFIAGHGELVQPCIVGFACQLHGIGFLGAHRPAIIGKPGIRHFVLQLIFELLAEQAAMVAKADAVAGQVQCGKAV